MGKFAIVLCLASAAFGQTAERAFHLVNATAVMSVEDIATALRSVALIQQVSANTAAATLTLKGTPDQVALAEWLIPQLDVTAPLNAGPQEYRMPGSGDDVIVVCGLVKTPSLQGIQSVATTIRTVAGIQKIFMVSGPLIVVLGGNASQIAQAEFLLSELDQGKQTRQSATVHELPVPGSEGTVVVYGLAHTEDPVDIQEIITTLRSVLDVHKIFTVPEPKLIAMHVSASQLQMIKWLIPELARQNANTGENEMRVPGGNDDVVHVFYLSHATSVQAMNGLMTEIRRTAQIMKAFTRREPAALVLRGTADQIAMAGRIVEMGDR